MLLWRNAFPRSAKELESEKARGDAFTWKISLEARGGALSSMHSFLQVRGNPKMTSHNIIYFLIPWPLHPYVRPYAINLESLIIVQNRWSFFGARVYNGDLNIKNLKKGTIWCANFYLLAIQMPGNSPLFKPSVDSWFSPSQHLQHFWFKLCKNLNYL